MTRNNLWDGFAKEYDNLVQDTGDLYHKTYLNPLVLKSLGEINGKNILDLACGNGYFSRILAKKGGKVTGVDFSRQLIKLAKGKSILDIKYHVGSSDNMHFIKENTFDFIVSNIAFHDISNISKTVEECSRVIKKGGKLVFSIPHPAFNLASRAYEDGIYYKKVTRYMSSLELHHPAYKVVKHYHRPIGFYLTILIDNHFSLTGFNEISISHRKGEVVKDPVLLKFKQEIPTFLLIESISTIGDKRNKTK